MFRIVKEQLWRMKKHVKPSLFDLAYSSEEAKSGKPLATPELIKEYIKLGADPNEVRKVGKNKYRRPIFLANSADDWKIVTCLLENGANKDLDFVVEQSRNRLIKRDVLYWKRQSEPSLFDLRYGTESSDFKNWASPEMIEEYIKQGADVNEERPGDNPNSYKKPIFLANTYGDYSAFMTLIKRGATIDGNGEYDFLLQHCGDPKIRQELKSWQRTYNAKQDALEATRDLADLNYEKATAAEVQKLLDKGADVNTILRDQVGEFAKAHGDEYTPIFASIRAGNWEVFKTLVDNGANLSAYWEDYYPDYNECGWSGNAARGIEKIISWMNTHKDFLDAIQTERERDFRKDYRGWIVKEGHYWGEMVPMVQVGDDKQCYQGKNGIISLTAFEKGKNLVKILRHRKKVDSDRQETIGLLDSLNRAKASASRKSAKEAVVKEYRKKHPKSAGR